MHPSIYTPILIGVLTVMKQVNSLCSPPDTSWTGYVPTPAPVEFEGTPTACTNNVCHGPSIRESGLQASTLADGDNRTTTLNVNAVHAWSTNVSIVFTFKKEVLVQGINLYFYNIPSRNIGLPYDTVLYSVPSFIEGNQDLSQSDNQLRSVTLIPTSLSGTKFTVQFNFSDIDKIDWLLLTEVEICTEGTLPRPQPISFITYRITPTCTSTTISLSCSVENEGRFTWSWTLPSGVTQPPTFILDAGRTSVLELSQISSNDNGDYQCHVNYSGLHNFIKFPEATINITLTTENCTTSLAYSTPTSTTTTPVANDNTTDCATRPTTSTPTSTTPHVNTTTNTLITCSDVALSIAPFVGTSMLGFLIGLGVGLLLMGVITVCIVKKIKSRQISNQPKASAGPIYEDVDDCKKQTGFQTKTNEAYGMVSSSH